MKRKFLVLEGIDCMGKSTQMQLLKGEFKEAFFIHEPGFTRLGSRLRELIFSKDFKLNKRTELFLFLADRAQLFSELLSLKKDFIISDRSFISGLAYATDFEFEFLLTQNDFAMQGDLKREVVFLKGSKDLLINRLKDKIADNIEERGVDYLLNIQNRLEKVLNILEERGLVRVLCIDASKNAKDIHEKIKEFIR